MSKIIDFEDPDIDEVDLDKIAVEIPKSEQFMQLVTDFANFLDDNVKLRNKAKVELGTRLAEFTNGVRKDAYMQGLEMGCTTTLEVMQEDKENELEILAKRVATLEVESKQHIDLTLDLWKFVGELDKLSNETTDLVCLLTDAKYPNVGKAAQILEKVENHKQRNLMEKSGFKITKREVKK